MPELEFQAEVVLVEQVCDKCGCGLMKRVGSIMLTDPPKFPHKCESCDHIDNFTTSYPTPRFKKIEEPKQ